MYSDLKILCLIRLLTFVKKKCHPLFLQTHPNSDKLLLNSTQLGSSPLNSAQLRSSLLNFAQLGSTWLNSVGYLPGYPPSYPPGYPPDYPSHCLPRCPPGYLLNHPPGYPSNYPSGYLILPNLTNQFH